VLILAVIPFTVLAIRPTNNRLLDRVATGDRRTHRGF
jgi:hypothetical protein